jgi:hypothetical protein
MKHSKPLLAFPFQEALYTLNTPQNTKKMNNSKKRTQNNKVLKTTLLVTFLLLGVQSMDPDPLVALNVFAHGKVKLPTSL